MTRSNFMNYCTARSSNWPICAERLRDLLVANGVERLVNEENE